MGVIEQNKRKKYILVCAAIVFAIGVIFMAWLLYGKVAHGNGNQGGNILAGASPDTSALQMYYFDGETVSVRTFYDSDKEKKLIKRINAFGNRTGRCCGYEAAFLWNLDWRRGRMGYIRGMVGRYLD